MRKLVIFHYFSLSWPLFSHPEHTTFASSPLASSTLAQMNPLAQLNPLAESNLPSTRRIKDNSFQKSLFPLSRALRPFTSISAPNKPTKIIQPKYDFRTVVLDLTQAELSRQEEYSWYDHNDLVPTPSMFSLAWLIRLLDDTFVGHHHRDLNFRNSFYLPTQHIFFPITYSFGFMTSGCFSTFCTTSLVFFPSSATLRPITYIVSWSTLAAVKLLVHLLRTSMSLQLPMSPSSYCSTPAIFIMIIESIFF